MSRTSENWVDAFYDYTSFLPSPAIFRKWSAITGIAGALERKVWVNTQGSNLYPNLYTILVAPPGVGKSVVTRRIESLWQSLADHHVASSNVTKAALIDELDEAQRTIVRPGEVPATVSFNSLKVLSNELGVLVPQYDSEFMSVLTDLYDGSRYAERRRSAKDGGIKINNPQLNILTGTTPAHLRDFLPQGAFDQGFLSRAFLIYSGETKITPLFDVVTGDKAVMKGIQADFKIIGKLYGEMSFTPEAAEAITKWHMGGRNPEPNHPKLVNYNTRRTLHLLKLCMVSCAACTDDLVITIEHYQTALGWLLEAETFMPDIFKSMNSGGDGKVIEECWFLCMQYKARKKEPIPERFVYSFLSDRLPIHSVAQVLDIMQRSKIIKRVTIKGKGTCYEATPKENLFNE